jgi:hypothetical protein
MQAVSVVPAVESKRYARAVEARSASASTSTAT